MSCFISLEVADHSAARKQPNFLKYSLYKPLKSYSEASEGHFNCSHSLRSTAALGVHVVYWIIPSNSDWSSPKVLVVWKVTVKWHCRFLYIFSRWIPDPIFSVHEWKEAYFLFPFSQTQPAIWKPSRVLLTSCLITSNKDPASRVLPF